MLRRPCKKDIYPGAFVDILDRDGGKKGKAKLIRRNPSKYQQDNLPYIKYEDSNEDDSKCRIWSFERWLVEWVHHSRLQGLTDSTEVHYFVKVATHTSSVYDPMYIRSVDSSIRFVFLEVGGVIEIGGEFCSTCVNSLNKLWKSFKKPDVVFYYHNQLRAKEQMDLCGFKGKIGGFIDPKETGLEEGIRNYLELNDCEDYLIVTSQNITFDPERTIITEKLDWKK